MFKSSIVQKISGQPTEDIKANSKARAKDSNKLQVNLKKESKQ